jgi:hypothetical protein
MRFSIISSSATYYVYKMCNNLNKCITIIKEKMTQSLGYDKIIKEATYNVIKTALEIGFDENSNFIQFYCRCAKSIRDSHNPEETVRSSSLKIFPDEFSYDEKKSVIIGKYRGALQKDLLNLYHFYNILATEERERKTGIITDDTVDNLLDSLIN